MASNNGRHDGTRLVVRYLNEAHATEGALVTALTAHLSITPPGSYRKLLERHLAETREQAEAIERRLSELGATTSVIQAGTGLVQTAIGQVSTSGKVSQKTETCPRGEKSSGVARPRGYAKNATPSARYIKARMTAVCIGVNMSPPRGKRSVNVAADARRASVAGAKEEP